MTERQEPTAHIVHEGVADAFHLGYSTVIGCKEYGVQDKYSHDVRKLALADSFMLTSIKA